MKSFSARRLIPACALTAACVAAAAGPSVASAATTCKEGADVHGKGASFQKSIQLKIWNPGFNTSADSAACSGTQGEKGKPKVTYTSTGSGPGLESWGVQTKPGGEIWFGKNNAYVESDDPPSKKQGEEIESHTEGAKLLTIPVVQGAIAIVVHLPKGCLGVEGGPTPGVIAIKQKTLEQVFEGKKTKWSQILNKAKMKEATKKSCEKTGAIKRVVRKEGSGTTAGFKKWLGVVNKQKPVMESGKTWTQEAQEANNIEWPKQKEDPTIPGEGGGGIATVVATTEGTIGYTDLASARGKAAFIPSTEENPAKEKGTGGPGSPTFWLNVENEKGSYANPASNLEVGPAGHANCEGTVYTNGGGKVVFPPPGTEEFWSEVTESLTQKHYEPCILTYGLALTKFKGASKGVVPSKEEEEKGEPAEPSEESVNTVIDYFQYMLSPGGQTEATAGDYLALPTNADPAKNVLKIAQEGVAKIAY